MDVLLLARDARYPLRWPLPGIAPHRFSVLLPDQPGFYLCAACSKDVFAPTTASMRRSPGEFWLALDIEFLHQPKLAFRDNASTG